MNRRDSWLVHAKRKLGSFIHGQNISTSQHSDKLPPRLQKHGISVAARVIGNEIKKFTKSATGKDLSQIKNSRTRQMMLTKLSAIRVAVTNKETQYNLLSLACDTGSNLVPSLSPEGPECDYNFKKDNFMRDFIAKYHKECISDCATVPELKIQSRKRKLDRLASTDIVKSKPKISQVIKCRCELDDFENKGKFNFLGCWQHKGIPDDDMENYLNENLQHFLQENKKELTNHKKEEWSHFLENEKYVVFRRKIKGGIYEYRIQATFPDISAHKLFQTQVDGGYRKLWDEYVLSLDVVDSDHQTCTDLVHWVTKCPYPFSTREYIYLRRQKVDVDNKYMVLYSKATDNTDIPKDKKVERVDTYVSKLIIKAHDEFHKNGCDFLLTYYDDPKMMLPRSVLDLAASRGITDSMSRMYSAASLIELSNDEKKAI